MPGSFEVDVVALRCASGAARVVAADLDDAVDRLRSGLDRLGEPWGDDEPGRAFAGQHVPASEALLDHLVQLVAGLGSIGDGLGVMAERYEEGDAASTIPRARR